METCPLPENLPAKVPSKKVLSNQLLDRETTGFFQKKKVGHQQHGGKTTTMKKKGPPLWKGKSVQETPKDEPTGEAEKGKNDSDRKPVSRDDRGGR